jgi:hypothetical protein
LPRAADAGVTVLVVALPFCVIAENGVGLRGFLEAVLGLLIARIAVRVILHRQLAVGAFDHLG